MKPIYTAFILIFLITLAYALPALGGGWAVITLDEWPAGAIVGQPLSVRFAVRQHGMTLMEGLEATIQARNQETGESMVAEASPNPRKPGHYEATLSMPSAGTWEWSIQAFTMNQRMPDLVVSSSAQPATASAGQKDVKLVLAGYAGLMVALAALAFSVRKRARWALALVLLGLMISGAGFASAASKEIKVGGFATGHTVPQIETGQDLFVAKGCVTCHANDRIDSKYYDLHMDIGPNLTRFTANPEYLRTWLRDPSSVRADAEMPDLELDEVEIEALIAFLNGKTGQDEEPAAVQPKPEQVVTAKPLPKIPVTATPAQKIPAGEKEACSDLDSKRAMLVSYSRDKDNYLSLMDPAKGLPLCNHERISLGNFMMHAYSPDRLGLAVLNAESPAFKTWRLHWIDLLTWKATDGGVVLPDWPKIIAVHPDDTRIAVVHALLTEEPEPRMLGYRLVQTEIPRKGETLQATDLDIDPRLMAYTGDGQHILLYGVKYDYIKGTSIPPAKLRLLNAADLSLVWEAELNDVLEGVIRTGDGDDPIDFTQWQPALALSPDRDKLYIVHADADHLTSIDLVEHRITTLDIQPQLSLFERLLYKTAGTAQAKVLSGTTKQAVLSHDSTHLYVTGFTGLPQKDKSGNWQFDILPFGLQVINVIDGD